MTFFTCLFSVCFLATVVWASPAEDLVTTLPHIPFVINYEQYAGYLDGGWEQERQQKIFYWFVKYNGKNMANDTQPVLLWLNGGPGCSSVNGAMTENGPLRTNPDGVTIYENIFAWNKVAHVLFIESPPGVGFSYSVNRSRANLTWSDDETARMNYRALKDFFENKFPEYINREWYISGESYAGVYIPTLATLVVDGIKDGSFNNTNLMGLAIGNGFFNEEDNANSLVEYQYYHGVIGMDEWANLQKFCCDKNTSDTCNYFQHIKSLSVGNYTTDGTACGNLAYHSIEFISDFETRDAYNIYQSCYKSTKEQLTRRHTLQTVAQIYNQEKNINYDSTDHLDGAPCFGDASQSSYLNIDAVQTGLHVADEWKTGIKIWQFCNDWLNMHYNGTNAATDDLFMQFLPPFKTHTGEVKALRMLFYNGDVDSVCNFLGTQRFARRIIGRLGYNRTIARREWLYRTARAGYTETFDDRIDILTVNGAGHFVPLDRAGAALQMMHNFISNNHNYNTTDGLNAMASPLLPVAQHGQKSYSTSILLGLLALLALSM